MRYLLIFLLVAGASSQGAAQDVVNPKNVCGSPIPEPVALPPEGAGPVIYQIVPCFEAQEATGDEGLRLSKTAKVDLIVLEMNLSGVDGSTRCRQMRSHSANRLSAVVFASARCGEEDKVEGFSSGAVAGGRGRQAPSGDHRRRPATRGDSWHRDRAHAAGM